VIPTISGIGASTHERPEKYSAWHVAGTLSGQGLEKMQLKTFGRDFSPGSFVSTGRMIRSRFRHWRFRKRKGRAMNQPGPLSF